MARQRERHRSGSELGKGSAEQDTGHCKRAALAHEQVSREITREPALAKCRRVFPELGQHVTKTSPL